jgi:acyl dehydratase
MDNVYLEDIEPGQCFKSSRLTVTETHIVLFAGLTGDFNPMHMDAEAAKATRFGKVIAHGMLCASISAGLRSRIDDWAIVAMLHTSRSFIHPVYAGNTISFAAEVIDVEPSETKPELGVVKISVTLLNHERREVQRGVDTLLVRRRPKESGQ